MLRLLMLSTLLAAPAAAIAQSAAPRVAGWGVAEAPGSCMLHGASSQGTVISIWGFAGQDKLGFLIQNREWEQLREGQSVALELGFGGDRHWPVQATAKRNLDSDGPGFFFTFAPAGSEGGSILDSIASGKGMKISRDGAAVDHVALDGSREAVAGLARCIAALWSTPGAAAAGEELDKQDAEPQVDPTT
jgi:hypothetical protein